MKQPRGYWNKRYVAAINVQPLILILQLTLLLGCHNDRKGIASVQVSDANKIQVGRLTLAAPGPAKVSFQQAQMADIRMSWAPSLGMHLKPWLEHHVIDVKTKGQDGSGPAPLVRQYQIGTAPANLFLLYPDKKIHLLEEYRIYGDNVFICSANTLPDEITKAEQLISSVMENFHPYRQDERAANMPGGFGVAGGVVVRPFQGNEDAEAKAYVDAGIRSQILHTTLQVGTHVYANATASTLPARARKAELGMMAMKVQSPGFTWRTIRNGSRTVADVAGNEYVFIVKDAEHGDHYAVHGEFEYGGDSNDPRRPYLQIVLDTEDVPPSITDRDLLKLWDDLLKSARFNGQV